MMLDARVVVGTYSMRSTRFLRVGVVGAAVKAQLVYLLLRLPPLIDMGQLSFFLFCFLTSRNDGRAWLSAGSPLAYEMAIFLEPPLWSRPWDIDDKTPSDETSNRKPGSQRIWMVGRLELSCDCTAEADPRLVHKSVLLYHPKGEISMAR